MSGRIRSIKPEWLEDEALVLSSSDARVLSVALILLADDYGNGRANRLLLRSRVFPVADQSVLESALGELERIDFVKLYEQDGQSYFHIRNWDKHQRVDKPGKNRVPPPRKLSRESRENSRESRERIKRPTETLAPDLDHDHDHDHTGEAASSKLVVASASKSKTDPVFEHWVSVMGRSPSTLLTTDRKKAIKRARSEGYSDEQLCQAVDGCRLSDFHMGKNDRDKPFNDLPTILKSGEAIDEHIRRAGAGDSHSDNLFPEHLRVGGAA